MEDEDAWKLILPAVKRESALLESHAEPKAGHLGRAKQLARLSLYYYWPFMRALRTLYAATQFANNAKCRKQHQRAS